MEGEYRENEMQENTAEPAEKKLTAKALSKAAMICATLWVAVLTILRGLGFLRELNETDIIYSGVAMVGFWSPTYLSIWLDKIKSIRFGDGAEGGR